MTYIYAPEQSLVWYKSSKGGSKTTGKFRAKFIEPYGRMKARILIESTGERKIVDLDSIVSISSFKGSQGDLR